MNELEKRNSSTQMLSDDTKRIIIGASLFLAIAVVCALAKAPLNIHFGEYEMSINQSA